MVKKGKFIVIEGIDSSGKNTQFMLLSKRLKKRIPKLKIAEFPRYGDSTWGKMLAEYLNGKYGKFNEIHPKLTLLLFMLDEYTWSRDVGRHWLKNGGWILSDRFFTSNVHQIAKLKTRMKKSFRDWVWSAGYKDLKILKPDLVVFLDVNPKHARNLLKKRSAVSYLKGKKKDIAEREFQHQKDTYREYLHTVSNQKFWKSVKCTTKGKLNSPELIHENVWDVVKSQI